jgi:cytoskeletal protein RodZ
VKSVGTLGKYLSSARELKGFDLHDAAQQTRISIQYLKALESEDFAKLPGEVFVRGFLKNYAKFLGLPEQDVLQKYGELRHAAAAGAAAVSPQPAAAEQAPAPQTREKPSKVSLEPWLWGTAIFISVLGFLFMAAPDKQQYSVAPLEEHTAVLHTEATTSAPPAKPEKLYLQIVALEDVWLLVRTDTGPQKKAVLKKDENVIWIADERFLLSYGSAGAAKLLLNGEELTVTGQKNAVVRDLEITAAGITSAKAAPVAPRAAKPRQQPAPRPTPLAGQATGTQPVPQPQVETAAPAPAPATVPVPEPAPETSTPVPEPSSLP